MQEKNILAENVGHLFQTNINSAVIFKQDLKIVVDVVDPQLSLMGSLPFSLASLSHFPTLSTVVPP